MAQEPFWKRELKELFAISFTFFVFFILLLLLKKAILTEYQIKFHAAGIALVGSLILGKVVLIFNNIPMVKKYDYLPKIYGVFIKSLVYLAGFIIFTLLEHWIKGLIKGDGFLNAWEHAFNYIISKPSIIDMIIVFIVFLIFNTFWVIRNKIGAKAMHELFFKRDE